MKRYALYPLIVLLTVLSACRGGSRQTAVDPLLRDSVKVLLDSGKTLRDQARFKEALQLHEHALELATRIGDTLNIIAANNNLGTDMRRMGLLDAALAYHYSALKLCDEREDDTTFVLRKSRVVSLNGMGNIELSLGAYSAAEAVFRRALAGETALGSDLGQAINLANLGAIKEEQGDVDSARWYFQQSLHHNQRIGSMLGIALCHTHFGHLYEMEQHSEQAIAEYKLSYEQLSTTQDLWHTLEPMLSLARIYLQTGARGEARQWLDKAFRTAKQIGSREHEAEVYRQLSALEEQQGNMALALRYYQYGHDIQDSIVSAKNVDDLQNLRLNYEREKSQRELAELTRSYEEEQAAKHLYRWLAIIVAMLAVAATAFLVYAQRMRLKNRRANMQIEKMRTTFYTNITHEFRTPLTIVKGLAAQIRERTRTGGGQDKAASAADVSQMCTTIEKQSDALLLLINQLLDLQHIMSGTNINEEWVNGNIVTYTTMAAESYKQYVASKGLSLTFSCREARIDMDFVPEYMDKILRNLIGNSVKFTPKGGNIVVSLEQLDTKVRLEVIDSGCGFPEKEMPLIFNMFYQGTNSNQLAEPGTGVGLSFVRQMVDRMHGTITASNGRLGGACISIVLPQTNADVTTTSWNAVLTPADGQAAKGDDNPGTQDDGREQVLVVEDNTDLQNYFVTLLSKKYSVVTANDGLDALQKLGLSESGASLQDANGSEARSFDLIITDLMMPRMNGFELCKKVRQSDEVNHIPIIVVTALNSEEDRLHGVEAGADTLLAKPFNAAELYLQMERLLNERRLLSQKFSQSVLLGQGAQGEVKLDSESRQFIVHLTATAKRGIGKRDYNVNTLAQQMGMSYTQLSRKLKNIAGTSPAAFITQLRLEKARKLLLSSEASIGDIATQCGFDDPSYFTRTFKTAYGDTPKTYRLRNK